MAKRKNKNTRSLSKMSRSAVLTAEQSHYGSEPDFTDSVEAGLLRMNAVIPAKEKHGGEGDPILGYLKALNWYNACGDAKNYKKWIVEYASVKLKLSTADLKLVRKITDASVPRDVAVSARIHIRGGAELVPGVKRDRVDEFCAGVVAKLKEKEEVKKAAPVADAAEKSNKPSVQEYMQIAAEFTYSEKIIPLIDETFSSGGKKAPTSQDVYTLLSKDEVKGRVALKIAELIKPHLDELQEAIDKKDEELVEAYSYLTLSKQKKVATALQAMLDDCERVNNVSKQTRKTTKRAKKPLTADKILAKFKFKAKDDDFKIASIDPKSILGAGVVVLFNAKTRKATLLIAADKSGLSIKGASIIGFDEKLCVLKTIRKPSEFFAGVKGKGKRAITKVFDGINAKNGFKNGKSNEHTIILRNAK